MAFPAVQTADTQSGTVASNTNPWTLTYPTNLASGDLILAFIGLDGGGTTTTWPADWLVSKATATAVSLICAKKLSVGTETGTFSVDVGASEQGGWRVFRITDWGGTIGSTFPTGDVGFSDGNAGTTNVPDPFPLNPASWDVEDTLWVAVCAADTSRTISVYPLPDLNTADVSGGAGGATLGVCMTNSAVASLDPGTFTISAADDWVTRTVAVRPAAAAVANPFPTLVQARRL